MEFSSSNFAVAISLISNCIAIFFLIFMLIRILSESSGTHRLVREGSENLIRAGEQLNEAVLAADEIVLKMRGAAAVVGEKGVNRSGVAGSLTISPEGIKILSRLMQSLSQHTLKEMDSILLEMRQLLSSLKQTSPEGLAAWQQQNQGVIDRILNVEGMKPEVILTVQTQIEESKVLTQELERAEKLAEGQNQDTEQLSAQMMQQEQLIDQMRERTKRVEERAQMLDQQIKTLSNVEESRKNDVQELDRVRKQNNQLSQERSSLVRHLETLTSEIKRTKLEKEFIEDRLLSMLEQSPILPRQQK